MLEKPTDALELARELMRAQTSRRRALEKELDSIWRALESVSVSFVESTEHIQGLLETSVLEGADGKDALRLTLRQTMERLEDSGIGLDGAVGEVFDPRRHRAIEELAASRTGELFVVKVLSRGVTCAGRRFKPADVVVRRGRDRE
ncbi:MAG TPA: nucleotide exchange factor GrpE [Vicinamibacteria bacterium]|nr:nucleotide exchange factor GrpE [Vicinamibacteria bacterium]